MWYVTNQKQGVNALGIQRVLGLGSYQTAWTMLHRLRRAMIRPGRERLHGVVEVDESFVGRSVSATGPAVKRQKQSTNQTDLRHTIVAIAVEIKTTKGFGRIRLRLNAWRASGSRTTQALVTEPVTYAQIAGKVKRKM